MSQRWAERRRRLLVIVPSHIVKAMAAGTARQVWVALFVRPADWPVAGPDRAKRGWLQASRLMVSSFDTEEIILLAGMLDNGEVLHEDYGRKLLFLEASAESGGDSAPESLAAILEAAVNGRLNEVSERNARHFDAEVAKLDGWAEDLKLGLEQQIKELDREIREARRQSAASPRLEDKLEAQRTLRRLETERRNKRRDLFEEQDHIDAQRDDLIVRIEKQMQRTVEVTPLFTVRWTLEA